MKLISWNVNGINALLAKPEAKKFLENTGADIICLQEMKATKEKMPILLGLDGYVQYNAIAEKKGYSGTTILTKKKPLSVQEGLGIEKFDKEGRTITLEYEEFYIINCYFPNAQPELARITYKTAYNQALETYAEKLAEKKGVIITGDLNVAHKEIDLARPKANEEQPGYSTPERKWIDQFLQKGWTDTYRYIHGDIKEKYSWWTYRANARKNNVGWRIDYFLTSKNLQTKIKDADILMEQYGSDHCPVSLELDIQW